MGSRFKYLLDVAKNMCTLMAAFFAQNATISKMSEIGNLSLEGEMFCEMYLKSGKASQVSNISKAQRVGFVCFLEGVRRDDHVCQQPPHS